MLTWAGCGGYKNSARGVADGLDTGRRRSGLCLGFDRGSLPCS